ncbi:MAG: hypothetical protein M3Z24_04650 [Chloroflexota bacterium]|nr:hypothetical protein [Chloroflexota bacterium]
MSYQMIVTLTDQEYAVLAAEAAKDGKQPEMFLRDIIQRLQSSSQVKRPMTGRELAEQLYREGNLANVATQRTLTEEEQAQREQLIQKLTGGKPASEMVIEDRGSY